MSNLTTLPKGDSAWLLRKSIQRIMQQVSVLETNIGSSTTGNSSNTQVIFNDNGTLRGDAGLTYNAATDTLSAGSATITGNLTLSAGTVNGVGYLNGSKVLTAGSTLLFDGTNLGIAGTGQFRFATSGGAIGDNTIGTENSFSMMLRCGRGSTSNIELASDRLVFSTSATERMRVDSSGNVGIGVTPLERLTVAGTGSFGGTGNTGIKFHSASPLSNNLCWLLANDQANSNILNLYYYSAGVFSGRAFVVNQSGNFMVRTPSTPPTIPDNEMMVFNLTSNTNLRISVKGTDGTTRTANITLA